MLRTPTRSHSRRGAVLIFVLAMLVLIGVLGLSLVVYSEAQLSDARIHKMSVNQDTKPNPQLAAEGYLGGFIYDVGDTGDDLANPIRGHSLARSKYGYQAGSAGVPPFNASPIPQEQGAFNFNGITDSRQIVRFTWDPATNRVFDPERYYNGAALRNSPTAALTGSYSGKNYAFTYPDRHDYYLAFQDPATGQIVLPSFHRLDLGSWNPADANFFESQGSTGQFKTLRPRGAEHPNFPPVPPNADGTYTGDVQNMKFTAGVQHNDSLWMDAGGPVLRWRGKNYKAMVAPLILDLSSRVNISIAGNRKLGQTFTAGNGNNDGTTGGSQGLGPWEIDPQQLGISAADVQALVARRQGNSAHPPRDPYTALNLTARINGLKLPPAYSSLDADGDGTRAAPPLANDAFTLPAADGFSSFSQYTRTGVTRQRYPTTPAEGLAEVTNHPAQFNPLVYPRGSNGPGGFGHDDLIRLASRYSDPTGRSVATSSVPNGLASLTPAADTPAARQARAMTTTFSVTQQWASVTVATNNTGGTATLGPVDLNRPLPDYRKNPALPLSPLNIWPVGSAEYNKAHAARHQLARDIFIRLGAVFIDGTSATYDPATGNVTVLGNPATDQNVDGLGKSALYAANLVDYIDSDDLVTAFVWNPTAASLTSSPTDPSLDSSNFATPADTRQRVVFGTELPRLVINEVYSGVFNDRSEEAVAPPMNRSATPLKRRYWLELHNPTPPEPISSLARSDGGAARLRYVPNVTQLPDPVTGVVGNYTGTDFNPYRIEIAEVPAPATGIALPYSVAMLDFPTAKYPGGKPILDTATVPNMTLKVRIDLFAPDATAPAAASDLAGDGFNVVRPTTGAGAANTSTQGYFLIGPKDPFPAGGVNNSMSLTDAAAGVPTAAAPVNTLAYDVTVGAPAEVDIIGEAGKSSVVILRRLLDPYRPAQENPALANFNPFITVDYLENVPTRDRAKYNSAGSGRAAASSAPSVGRIHPYANNPHYGFTPPGGQSAVQDQVAAGAAIPPHTFSGINNPADNNRTAGVLGFEWLVHPDRELISTPEFAHVSEKSPALLAHFFYNGAFGYQNHLSFPPAWRPALFFGAPGFLDTASRLPGTPLGGRVPGRVNLNTINSLAVLQAVFGRTDGTNFAVTNPTQVADVWNILSPVIPPAFPNVPRTPNRVPRATVFEGGNDLPFIWGRGSSPDVSNRPVFQNPNAQHDYHQIEPARKIWNSITPVSDTFLVVMTVGFFEVENGGPWDANNPPRLGLELFDKVKGDLRVQFTGVLDRSQLATQVADPFSAFSPNGNRTIYYSNVVGVGAATGSPQWSVQTKLTQDVQPGAAALEIEAVPPGGTVPDGTTLDASTCAILGDGMAFRVSSDAFNATKTGALHVGYGDLASGQGDGEWLYVKSVSAGSKPGTVKLDLDWNVGVNGSKPKTFHGASSPVSNVLYGNPGPQPGVTLKRLAARGVVPYFTRLDP